MPIQKETKNSERVNIFQEAMTNVFFAHNWCSEQLKHAITPYDITPQQFNVLRILRGQHPKPSTINLIKARMLDKMSDASRIVERLVQKGLLDKATNEYDKRAVDILISTKGLALLKKMDYEVDLSSILSPALTKQEAEQLNKLLDKISRPND